MLKREVWIDYMKVCSCLLVAVGHFCQSMILSGILPANTFYYIIVNNLFNVQIFMLCSGYLYQKTAKFYNAKSWTRHILRKLIDLGVPYLTFTIITIVLKTIFESDVNTPATGFMHTLLIFPIAPYWFLYVLFFLFLLIPACRKKATVVMVLAVTVALKIVYIFFFDYHGSTLPFLVDRLMQNGVWFALGIAAHHFAWSKYLGKHTLIIGLLFIPLSVLTVYVKFQWRSTLIQALAVILISSVLFMRYRVGRHSRIFSFLSRYTMVIFLTHTIFAAGMRTVLFRLGIEDPAVHVTFGMLATYLGPVVLGVFMKRLKYPEILIYPTKIIRIRK